MTKRTKILIFIALLLATSYFYTENPDFYKNLNPKVIREKLSVAEDYPEQNTENGDIVDLEEGETYTVRLEGNITTGYQWDVDYNQEILKLIRQDYIEAQGTDDIVGRGGIQEFEFAAIKKGSDEVWFYYHRPWEENSIIKDVNVTFVVREL